jgi:hypothetical protein
MLLIGCAISRQGILIGTIKGVIGRICSIRIARLNPERYP